MATTERTPVVKQTMSMRRIRPLIAGAALAVTIAACGAAQTPVTPRESASASAAVVARLYIDDDAKAALLTLADMPAGYVVDAGESKSETKYETACANRWYQDNNRQASHEAWFGKGASGPFIFHSVTAAPTEIQARDSVAELRALPAQCPVFTDNDGATYTLHEANYGSFGDETFALRATVSTKAGPFTVDLVVIRKVNLLSLVGAIAILSDASDLPQVVEKAAAKLPM
jgi:hypothetical protein